MLKNIREQVTLTGDSMKEEEVVVTFTCRIGEDGIAGSVNIAIRNHGLYQEHRNQVRQDQQEFQMKVWEVEDRLMESGE